MNVNSGRYSLVKKSTIDNECEYFDFSPNILDFVDEPSLDGTTKVSLATIDALTAAFDNPRELCEYFSKSRIPREEFASLISIDYKSQKGEDKSICTIWQDDTLQKQSRRRDFSSGSHGYGREFSVGILQRYEDCKASARDT